MIEARSISVSLAGRGVLSGVSLAAEAGEHVALVGPNGAGKSTLLRALSGVQALVDGEVHLGGAPITDMDMRARGQILSHLPQDRELNWDLRVEDVVALGRYAWGGERYCSLGAADRDAVDAAMEKTGAIPYIGRSARGLSGGERARVHLARALATEAQVLLLDEPCAALDIRHQLELMHVLETERAAGRVIVTALHDLELAERFCSRIVVIDAGEIAYEGALNDSTLSSVFGLKRRVDSGFDHA